MLSAISAPAGRRSRSSCAATAMEPASAKAGGRPEAMAWCERRRIGYIFGLAGNPVLLRQVSPLTEDAALGRLAGEAEKVRRYGEFRYAAKSWNLSSAASSPASRPVPRGPTAASSSPICRACRKRSTTRSIAPEGGPRILIKAHKLHLASDRTSCSRATANQFRLLIHTAAYWLMLSLRGLAPRNSFWREAQFDTIRLCLIKIAGRVTEMVTRIKVALPTRVSLPGRVRHARRTHRQTAAITDGAIAPKIEPSGPTSNPDHRVTDATKLRTRPNAKPRIQTPRE